MENLSLFPDHRDILLALLAAQVEFLVIGGFAFSSHAYPRTTKDIDIWVHPTPENAHRVITALRAFGAPLEEHSVNYADFSRPGPIYQMGVPPVRIDLMTATGGVTFPDAWARRTYTHVDDVVYPTISLDDLIATKLAAGRKRDLLDVEDLLRVKAKKQSKTDSK